MTIIEHPKEFKQGIRVLMRIHRTKDGGTNKGDRHAKKYVTRNEEEFDKCFNLLVSDLKEGERIYSDVDERDVDTAIRNFKYLQLDFDYHIKDIRNDFYFDIRNRFISSLAVKSARKTKYFLIDIDEEDDENEIYQELLDNDVDNTKIIHKYNTKNGIHIITEPFNYKNFKFRENIKHNAKMLFVY